MVIGIDATRANLDEKTGTEWYSYFLIQELKKIVTHGRVLLYSREYLKGDLATLPENFENRILKWPPILLWTQIRLSFETFVNPPDVLFIPAHTIPIIGRAKTVMTVHDVGFCVYPELYSWIDILYHRFSIWWASKFAWKILCPSEFTKQELIKYYKTDPGKIHVIPHGAPEISYSQNLARKNYLLYIGRLEKKKNILGILRAFKIVAVKHPEMKLVLAGRPGYGYERIIEYIQEQNLKNSVEIRGYVSEVEKSRMYKEARAFIFPTLYEGFGMPILEAQSYGCPVVTSDRGANAEVAGDSAVLVNPDSSEEIAVGIAKLLDDDNLQKDITRKGIENAKKYSWMKTAETTYKVLTGE